MERPEIGHVRKVGLFLSLVLALGLQNSLVKFVEAYPDLAGSLAACQLPREVASKCVDQDEHYKCVLSAYLGQYEYCNEYQQAGFCDAFPSEMSNFCCETFVQECSNPTERVGGDAHGSVASPLVGGIPAMEQALICPALSRFLTVFLEFGNSVLTRTSSEAISQPEDQAELIPPPVLAESLADREEDMGLIEGSALRRLEVLNRRERLGEESKVRSGAGVDVEVSAVAAREQRAAQGGQQLRRQQTRSLQSSTGERATVTDDTSLERQELTVESQQEGTLAPDAEAGSTKTTDSTKEAESTKEADSTKEAESTKEADSTKEAESTKDADSTKEAESTKGTDPMKEADTTREVESLLKTEEVAERGVPANANTVVQPETASTMAAMEQGTNSDAVATMINVESDGGDTESGAGSIALTTTSDTAFTTKADVLKGAGADEGGSDAMMELATTSGAGSTETAVRTTEAGTDTGTLEAATEVGETEVATEVGTTEAVTEVRTTEAVTEVGTAEEATDVGKTDATTGDGTTEAATVVGTTEAATVVGTTEAATKLATTEAAPEVEATEAATQIGTIVAADEVGATGSARDVGAAVDGPRSSEGSRSEDPLGLSEHLQSSHAETGDSSAGNADVELQGAQNRTDNVTRRPRAEAVIRADDADAALAKVIPMFLFHTALLDVDTDDNFKLSNLDDLAVNVTRQRAIEARGRTIVERLQSCNGCFAKLLHAALGSAIMDMVDEDEVTTTNSTRQRREHAASNLLAAEVLRFVEVFTQSISGTLQELPRNTSQISAASLLNAAWNALSSSANAKMAGVALSMITHLVDAAATGKAQPLRVVEEMNYIQRNVFVCGGSTSSDPSWSSSLGAAVDDELPKARSLQNAEKQSNFVPSVAEHSLVVSDEEVLGGFVCEDHPKDMREDVLRQMQNKTCESLVDFVGCVPKSFFLPLDVIVAACKQSWFAKCAEKEGVLREVNENFPGVVDQLTKASCQLSSTMASTAGPGELSETGNVRVPIDNENDTSTVPVNTKGGGFSQPADIVAPWFLTIMAIVLCREALWL